MRYATCVAILAALPSATPAGGFQFFDPLDSAAVPKRLSETGLFQGLDPTKPGEGVHPFSVNTALWSDGAVKSRHVIPPPGSKIGWRRDSAFTFPAGTVFAKTFLIDTVKGEPASRIALETRLLVKRFPDGASDAQWYGFSYRWQRDQMEAVLVDPESGLDTVFAVHDTDGSIIARPWTFPSQNACWRCHLQRGRQVLGFFAAQLHGAVPGRDQLADLADLELFTQRPDTAGLHRWRALNDSTASPESRARSYLAANCSFCHGAEGFRALGAFLSALHDFDWFRADTPINYLNKSAKYDYGIPGSLLLYGGDPARSVLIHRMVSRTKSVQMPPLATFAPDTAALEMISTWIRALPGPAASGIDPERRNGNRRLDRGLRSGYDVRGKRVQPRHQ